MPASILILAEISDKMMSWPALVLWTAGLVCAAWFLTRWKKWLAIVPFPFALLFAWGALDDIQDPWFRAAVIEELGYSYIALGFVPLLALLVFVCVPKKRVAAA